MAAHYNRGATFPEAPVLPDDPLIDALARTNAKVEDFAISPDGSRIAYVSAESGGYDLWIVNIDGSNNRCIVHMYPEQCLLPSWSPDGEWLSYGSRYDSPTGNLYIVRADGSEPPYNITYDNSPGRYNEWTRWTPDGKEVVFTGAGPTGFSQVKALPTSIPTGKVRPRLVTNDEWNNTNVQVSPDGKWVAFQSDRSGYADSKRMDVFIAPITGGPGRNLTPNTKDHHDSHPRWSADGTRIAFVSDRTGLAQHRRDRRDHRRDHNAHHQRVGREQPLLVSGRPSGSPTRPTRAGTSTSCWSRRTGAASPSNSRRETASMAATREARSEARLPGRRTAGRSSTPTWTTRPAATCGPSGWAVERPARSRTTCPRTSTGARS